MPRGQATIAQVTLPRPSVFGEVEDKEAAVVAEPSLELGVVLQLKVGSV